MSESNAPRCSGASSLLGQHPARALGAGLALVCGLNSMGCSDDGAEPPGASGGTSGAGASTGNNDGTSGSSTGGTAGAGATTSMGGTGGGGSGITTAYTFDSDVQEFRINWVCLGTGNCMAIDAPVVPAPVDAGAGDAAAPPVEPPPDNGLATVTHDAAVGSPSPGSLQLDINFTAAGQSAVLALNIDSTDLTAKPISAQVTVDTGAPATLSAKLYVKTGEAYTWADQGEITLVPGTWLPLTYITPTYFADMAAYNIADVREIGIEFAIPNATSFTPAVIHVDTVRY